MRRLSAWLAGFAGGMAAYRALRRRPARREQDTRAEVLRAKLAEARAAGDDRDEFEAGEKPVDQAADPETRRRAVHEQARSAIDEMSGD